MERIRVGLVGCGSVSGSYLPNLRESPYVELVSVCDVVSERARQRASENDVPHTFTDVPAMLAGPPFDLLINTTGMQTHYEINRQALAAGRHVLCEKPIATSVADGRELLDLADANGVHLWGAPNVVISPQFRCLAEVLRSGEIGDVHAAHACYGHSGPTWGPWFYRKGGGSLFDLGVYNVTTLTGLLGPAKAVVALSGTAIAERIVDGSPIAVEADDNTMILLDHGNAVYSHIQTGFVYGHQREDRTIELIGLRGAANLLGYDWGPQGVEVWSGGKWRVRCTESAGYGWQCGGSYLAECLATGKRSLMTGEHALHVLEVMTAALRSAETGQRVALTTTFPAIEF